MPRHVDRRSWPRPIRNVRHPSSRGAKSAYNIGATYASLQEPDDAVAWLEAAADDGFPCVPYFERDPNLDGLRTHQRFVDLMAALHKQWKRFKQMV